MTAAIAHALGAIVFPAAGVTAIGVIVATVAPQYDRIMRLTAQGWAAK